MSNTELGSLRDNKRPSLRGVQRQPTTGVPVINKLLQNYANLGAFDKSTVFELQDDETGTTIEVEYALNNTLSVTITGGDYTVNDELVTPNICQFIRDDEMALLTSALLLALTTE